MKTDLKKMQISDHKIIKLLCSQSQTNIGFDHVQRQHVSKITHSWHLNVWGHPFITFAKFSGFYCVLWTVGTSVVRILFWFPFPISRGQIQFFVPNSIWEMGNGMWAWKTLISDFPFLTSHISFPASPISFSLSYSLLLYDPYDNLISS